MVYGKFLALGTVGIALVGFIAKKVLKNRNLLGAIGTSSKYLRGGFEEEMTRKEAANILGVKENDDHENVTKAHRKLIMKNHPDTGGSPYVSAKINEAKELLLGKSYKRGDL